MKIFGITFITKKELKTTVEELTKQLDKRVMELDYLTETFPFVLGQVVYDVALKNKQGRYTKTNPSFEHSSITAVVVTEKNYFSLAKRLNNNDVFYEYEEAEEYIKSVCKNT